jgi:chromosome segregation ATPase
MNPTDILNKLKTGTKITDAEVVYLADNYENLGQQLRDAIKTIQELEVVIQYLMRRNSNADERADEYAKQVIERDQKIAELENLVAELRTSAADEERWSEIFRDQSESIWGIWRDAGRGWRVNF